MRKVKRQVRVDGDIAYVPLTRGYEAIIDANDVDLVKDHNWQSVLRPDNIIYAKRAVKVKGKGVISIFMHREIAGADPGEEVDHRDHDGLNNRRFNLRRCATSENQWNTGKWKSNTSGFKGVTWDKSKGKWKAAMQLNGKGKHLGHFSDPESASQAYQAACKKFHGIFYFEHEKGDAAP